MIKYMPGDWVLVDNEPTEITDIDPSEGINREWIGGAVCEDAGCIGWNRIEPIPLTQELLYKNTYDEASNTYHVYNTAGYVQYCITDRFVVKCYTDGEKEVFKYEGLVLEYVHDLQHLLDIARIDKKIIL